MRLHLNTLLSLITNIFRNTIKDNKYKYLEVHNNVLIYNITNEVVGSIRLMSGQSPPFAPPGRIGLNGLSRILIGIAEARCVLYDSMCAVPLKIMKRIQKYDTSDACCPYDAPRSALFFN